MNGHVRFGNFVKPQVHGRELFNPETTDWPVDDDHGANWDWLIFIVCAFGIASAIGSIGILAFLSSFFISWP